MHAYLDLKTVGLNKGLKVLKFVNEDRKAHSNFIQKTLQLSMTPPPEKDL